MLIAGALFYIKKSGRSKILLLLSDFLNFARLNILGKIFSAGESKQDVLFFRSLFVRVHIVDNTPVRLVNLALVVCHVYSRHG